MQSWFISFFLFIIVLLQTFSFVLSKENIYTLEEKAKIKEFREMVLPLIEEKYMNSDAYLFRWLKIKKFDLFKAKSGFEKNIKWRKENNMKNILSEDTSKIENQIPMKITGTDKYGRPALEYYLGRWQMRKYSLNGQKKEFVRHFDRQLEKTSKIVDEAQKINSNVTGWIYLVDFTGYSNREHSCIACISILVEFAQHFANYYPGYSKEAILYKTPRIFELTLKAVNPFLPDELISNVKAYTFDKKEFITDLQKVIPLTQVSPAFEGTFNSSSTSS